MSSEVQPYAKASCDCIKVELPVATESIQAGFPAPNGGYIDGKLDVNEFLICSPHSTYIYKVSGESMIEAGIMPGDYVLVDSSIKPVNGDVVVAVIDGEYTIKELELSNPPKLIPHNSEYAPIQITENSLVTIIGPVISVIRKYH